MAKPILYWVVKRRSWHTSKYEPFGVTSESPRGRLNGRYADNYASHCTKRDTAGKFDRLEDAQQKCLNIARIREDYAAKIEPLELKAREYRRDENNAIEKELNS